MRSTLPSRSPTTVFSWQSPRRIRGTASAYVPDLRPARRRDCGAVVVTGMGRGAARRALGRPRPRAGRARPVVGRSARPPRAPRLPTRRSPRRRRSPCWRPAGASPGSCGDDRRRSTCCARPRRRPIVPPPGAGARRPRAVEAPRAAPDRGARTSPATLASRHGRPALSDHGHGRPRRRARPRRRSELARRPPRRRRDGQARRRRAQLRQRRRPPVRRRGRSAARSSAPAGRSSSSPAAASGSTPTCDPRAATARSSAASTRTRRTGSGGPTPGSARRSSRPGRSPATRSSARSGRPPPSAAVWGAPFDADDLRHVRALKVRAEEEVRRRGVADREVKRGPGGIRDVEFSAQLLQLVHGRVDPDAPRPGHARRARGARPRRVRRPRTTPTTSPSPTGSCAGSSTRCSSTTSGRRTRSPPTARSGAASPGSSATRATRRAARPSSSTATSRRHRGRGAIGPRAGVVPAAPRRAGGRGRRSARRRRPTGWRPSASPTSSAPARRCAELTRGLTRSSRMMQQLLPLLLDWLSAVARPRPRPARPAPPRLGRGAVARPGQRRSASRRRSPATSRSLLGTSRRLGDILVANPDLIERLPVPGPPADAGWAPSSSRSARAVRSRWRGEPERPPAGAAALAAAPPPRASPRATCSATRPVDVVGADLTALAEASLEAALEALDAAGAVRGRRLRAPRRRRARLRQRPRRRLRPRGRRRGRGRRRPSGWRPACSASSAAARRPSAMWTARRVAAARGPQRPAGPQPRGVARPTSRAGPRPGSARPTSGSAAVAGDAELGDRARGRDRRRGVGAAVHRGRRARGPAHEGAHRAGAAGAGRGPRVPPQARARLAVRHRVHRAAAAAPPRRAGRPHPGRARRAGGGGPPPARRGRRARRGLPVLRAAPGTGASSSSGPATALPIRPEQATPLARSLGFTVAELRAEYRRVTRRARRIVERRFYDRG